ncbi:MerR family transcriptional regulator [Nitrolancea hollandica]|uniref:HTH merR-type domain-containing protein n=1 Tax=Nitrolancea hollandica Lb TaxID=1129897 RepID=I4EEV4_9BACT|nr:hypothetical protein NITHO_2030008 [Nitrolancea hollandica Lb]
MAIIRLENKEFYNITETALLLGIHHTTLRQWHREHKIKPARKNAAGHYIYNEADMQLIRRYAFGKLPAFSVNPAAWESK